jgi:hypothetical protein
LSGITNENLRSVRIEIRPIELAVVEGITRSQDVIKGLD